MPEYAFFHNKYMPLEKAKVTVLTHAMHYGTAVFEGMRANWDEKNQKFYLFRLKEHFERLLDGCRILKMDFPYTIKQLIDITIKLVEESGYREDIYLRPIVFKSADRVGVRLHDIENDFAMVALTLAAYLDSDRGVRCCISSWRKHGDSMIPTRGKICGVYVTSALAKSEAIERGFDEAILLTDNGMVSEGSGENIFVVMEGKLITPPSYDSILLGVTRDTVMQLAKNELGIETLERSINRSDLYIADEIFMTGTAAHVAPVIEVDEYEIGNGKAGKLTKKLQQLYLDTIFNKNPKYSSWLTIAYPKPKKKK
jgi:branched-chain amino acid aminotransferase